MQGQKCSDRDCCHRKLEQTGQKTETLAARLFSPFGLRPHSKKSLAVVHFRLEGG